MDTSLLAPAAVLALWTLVVLFWLAYVRGKAMKGLKVEPGTMAPGGRGQDLEGRVPPEATWPAHNYSHLVEQPTVFYAVILILFVAGGTTALTVGLAWGYTLLRIAHSIWQISVNKVPIRFALFLASTLCLTALAVLAVILTIG